MKNYKLELSRQADRELHRMASREIQIYRRVAYALDELRTNPLIGKALKGQMKGRYSYRVGSYRIIYAIERRQVIVYIIDIGHRREVYS